MAYLKGGSVVDGNLYVEGGLVVRNIATSAGGQLPTLDTDSAKSDHIIKFINDKGALFYTQLGESANGNFIFTDKDSFTFKVNGNSTGSIEAIKLEKDNTSVKIILENTSSKNTTIKGTPIYSEKGTEIKEDFISKITEDTDIPESFSY